MPSTRTTIAVAALVGLVLVAAGLGGTIRYHLRPSSDPAAVRATQQSAAAIDEATAYRYTVDGRVEARARDRTVSARVDGSGAVNVTTRRVHVEVAVEDEHEALFVHGYTVYRACPWSRFVNVEDARYADALPRNRSWTDYTFLGQLPALFRISKVYDRGIETVDGRRARVVAIAPNPRKLRQLSRRFPDVAEADGERRGRFAGGSMTVWIDTRTHLPLRLVVVRDRERLAEPDVHARFVYGFTYGPTRVPRPNETVPREEECPTP